MREVSGERDGGELGAAWGDPRRPFCDKFGIELDEFLCAAFYEASLCGVGDIDRVRMEVTYLVS